MDTLGKDRGLNEEVGFKFTLPSVQKKAVRNLLDSDSFGLGLLRLKVSGSAR